MMKVSRKGRVSTGARGLVLGSGILLAVMTTGVQAGASAATDGSQPIAACGLLTSADVVEVIGGPLAEPQGSTRGRPPRWMSMCNYDGETESGMVTAGLLIRPHDVEAGPVAAFEKHQQELIDQLGAAAELTAVEGLGQAAGWDMPNRIIGQLTVFEGPYLMILSVGLPAGGDHLAAAKDLARKVLARLPRE